MLTSCTATRGTHSHLISQMTLTLTQGKNSFILPSELSLICDEEKMCLHVFPLTKKVVPHRRETATSITM